MDQDFAKRRARTPLAEPSPPPPSSGVALLVTGLLTGIAVGLFIALLVYLSGVLPPPPGAADVAESGSAVSDGSDGQLTAELEREAARLQLEFYQELPNYEVVVDATPIAGSTPRTPPTVTATQISAAPEPTPASTPAPEAASTSAGTSAATSAGATPPAVAQTPAATPEPAVTPAPAAATAAAATPAAAPVSAVSTGRYLLQAGAFQQQPAALAQLNRLLALGLDARVRQETMPDRTLYLVQAGPYESRDEMIRAERLLRGNSIESMRITLSQP